MGTNEIEQAYKKLSIREQAEETALIGCLFVFGKVSDVIGCVSEIPKKIGKARLGVSEDQTALMYLPRGIFGEGDIIVIPDETLATDQHKALPVEKIRGIDYTRDTSGVGVVHRRLDGSTNVSVSPHFTIVPADPSTPHGFELGVPREVLGRMNNNTGVVE